MQIIVFTFTLFILAKMFCKTHPPRNFRRSENQELVEECLLHNSSMTLNHITRVLFIRGKNIVPHKSARSDDTMTTILWHLVHQWLALRNQTHLRELLSFIFNTCLI